MKTKVSGRVTSMMFFAMLALFSVAGNSYAGCTDCSPQCVPYARGVSGIKVYGVAIETLSNYDRSKYKISSKPKDNSMMILSANQNGIPWTGHAIAIQTSDKKSGEYKLKISQSNYNCKCSVETNVKAKFKDNKVTFDSGAWKGKKFKVAGIIVKK